MRPIIETRQAFAARSGNCLSLVIMTAAFAREMGLSRYVLAGHSMGGRVAMEVFRRVPQRITHLALLDTGCHALPEGEAGERLEAVPLEIGVGQEGLAGVEGDEVDLQRSRIKKLIGAKSVVHLHKLTEPFIGDKEGVIEVLEGIFVEDGTTEAEIKGLKAAYLFN